MLSPGHCIAPFVNTSAPYTECAVRCWGAAAAARARPGERGWNFPADDGTLQGRVSTVAGSNDAKPGFRNGAPGAARFNKPQGLAVDADGVVFVADTGNHVEILRNSERMFVKSIRKGHHVKNDS
ncbi:hypothetical protein EON66_11830 [archaeon]|nr:MAG: hypothetical protein EON66_11830 [archaeon]